MERVRVASRPRLQYVRNHCDPDFDSASEEKIGHLRSIVLHFLFIFPNKNARQTPKTPKSHQSSQMIINLEKNKKVLVSDRGLFLLKGWRLRG
jgi:hypothetical protein